MNSLQNERLALYAAAEQAVLTGQSYTIGNRTLTRANLDTIREEIDKLVSAGATLDTTTAPRRLSKRVVFMD